VDDDDGKDVFGRRRGPADLRPGRAAFAVHRVDVVETGRASKSDYEEDQWLVSAGQEPEHVVASAHRKANLTPAAVFHPTIGLIPNNPKYPRTNERIAPD